MPHPIDEIFDVDDQQCELLRSYLKQAFSYVLDSPYLYENEREELLSIAHQAVGNHEYSASAQLLRAFYCVEAAFMRVRQLDSSMGLGYAPAEPNTRTWKGLAKLKEQLSQCSEETILHHVALRLRGSAVQSSYDGVVKDQIPRMLEAVDILIKMIDQLRPALGREEPDLSVVGRLLADVTERAGTKSLLLAHARNLVNITKDNGLSPWEMKELQASSST